MSQTRWVNLAVVALLLLMVAEVALSTRQQSPSWDEGDHIYSGYMNWTRGEYSLNPEHPPLVKLIATLPLLPLHLKIAPRQNRFFKDEAYFGGRELIFRNAPQYGGLYTSDTLLFRVHMGALVFGLTLGLLLFLFAQEAFGPTAALIALALYVFDPRRPLAQPTPLPFPRRTPPGRRARSPLDPCALCPLGRLQLPLCHALQRRRTPSTRLQTPPTRPRDAFPHPLLLPPSSPP
jgi:hypothetical protein